MKPATPCFIEEKEIQLKEEKKFNVFSNKNNCFIVNFSKFSNYIQIKATSQNNINIEYEKIFYLNELRNNKFLSLCDSIDEIYQQINLELEKKNEKIIKEENNQVEIIIPVEHIKIKEIKFILYEKKKKEKRTN